MPLFTYKDKKKVKIWDGIEGYMHHTDLATFAYLTLAKGALAANHHHVAEQWSHVVEGELEFKIDGEIMLLKKGDCACIPSNVPHSAKAITKCTVIDSFLPFRQDLIDLENKAE